MKLPKLYYHPIIEFLIVYKTQGKEKYFLAQIAYDRYTINKSDLTIRMNNFSGWLMNSDWEDTPSVGYFFNKGVQKSSFDRVNLKNARPVQCNTGSFSYQTYEPISCGQNCNGVEITLHQTIITVCSSDPYYNYENSYYNWTSGNTNDAYYSVQQYQYPVANYVPRRAACHGGSDRSTLNSQLENALFATGLATNVTGWSLDKADALARSIGGNLADFKGLINGVGVAGVIIDSVQLGIGLWDGNVTFEEDGLNAIQLGLGIVGLVAGGWIAVGVGAISIGIAVYSQTTSGETVCQ